MTYFQDVEGVEVNDSVPQYETHFEVGDLLNINVAALEPEAAIPFNLYETQSATNPQPLLYLVDVDGNINFPVIGKIKVSGLSSQELTDLLEEKLSVYINNPIVNIRLKNFKVTVLGDVKQPGTYSVENERISIVEAIGLAGDLNIQGKRKTVKLIRVENGKRKIINIDLTNKALFNSPYFYLTQNDVIYVDPNKAKMNSSIVGPNTGIIFSSISTLISIIAIITR